MKKQNDTEPLVCNPKNYICGQVSCRGMGERIRSKEETLLALLVVVLELFFSKLKHFS